MVTQQMSHIQDITWHPFILLNLPLHIQSTLDYLHQNLNAFSTQPHSHCLQGTLYLSVLFQNAPLHKQQKLFSKSKNRQQKTSSPLSRLDILRFYIQWFSIKGIKKCEIKSCLFYPQCRGNQVYWEQRNGRHVPLKYIKNLNLIKKERERKKIGSFYGLISMKEILDNFQWAPHITPIQECPFLNLVSS